jgi:hypothetical protein
MKRKSSRRSLRKKQKGGNLLLHPLFHTIKFDVLEYKGTIVQKMSENITWNEIQAFDDFADNKTKGDLLLSRDVSDDMLTQEYILLMRQENIILCACRFTPKAENGEGYLNQLNCYKPLTGLNLKERSYLIMYKLFSILEKLNVQFCFLTPVAIGDKWWKLFYLYHNMGYVCIQETNLPNIKGFYNTQRMSNNTFFSNEQKRIPDADLPGKFKLGSKENRNASFRFYERCYIMMADVSKGKDKIERHILPLIEWNHAIQNNTTRKNRK